MLQPIWVTESSFSLNPHNLYIICKPPHAKVQGISHGMPDHK